MCPSWICDFDRTSGPEADVMSLSCLVLLKNGGEGVWLLGRVGVVSVIQFFSRGTHSRSSAGEKEAETPHGEGAGEPGV